MLTENIEIYIYFKYSGNLVIRPEINQNTADSHGHFLVHLYMCINIHLYMSCPGSCNNRLHENCSKCSLLHFMCEQVTSAAGNLIG